MLKESCEVNVNMPKCETCYHYDVCKNYLKELNYTIGVDIRATKCPFFKDKSLMLELPVKVGDTVYIQYKKKIYPVDVYAIRYDTKTNNKRICVEGWLQIDEWYQHSYSATFKWESIGKTVFLTHKDAEKALNEQKK